MKILMIFTVLGFSVSVVANAQSLSTDAPPGKSGPLIFALAATNRAGMSSEELKNGQYPIVRSESDTSQVHIATHLVHALVGTVTGTLGGAVLGAAIGYMIDIHSRGGDAIIPATYVLGLYGAIGGAAVGLVVGALWPTK